MNIWVSGVTGFSGAFLVDEIRRRYPRSRILGLGRRAACGLAVDVYMPVDLVSNPDLDSLCRQYPPQQVFHLAGAMPPVDSDAMQAKREDINRVYGDPRKRPAATGWQQRLSLSDSLRDMLEIYRS